MKTWLGASQARAAVGRLQSPSSERKAWKASTFGLTSSMTASAKAARFSVTTSTWRVSATSALAAMSCSE